nr:RNA-directed DNA polymerase, eukaryota, reverse transcriptase zinc-binding domain protein [Tanacetum cinerariifolium]
VCWNKVLAHKNKEGLGVNSLYALNLASIFKCIWRFVASFSSLWIKVIKSIHGNSGALDNPYSSRLKNFTWIGILKAINKLKAKGVDLMGFYKIVIENGSTTRFWHDIWYGDICFKDKFKRLFNLELQKDANVAFKLQASNVASFFRRPPRSGIKNSQFIELGQILSSISLSSVSDRWSWTLHGLGDFSVKSAREEIDKHVLVVSSSQNRWSNVLPIKLNVFSWRMMLDRVPTRNLTLFSLKKPRKDRIFDDIVSHTYFWLSNRCRSFNVKENKERTKSEQNRTKSRANGKRGKVQTQARQSQSQSKSRKHQRILEDKIICDLNKTPDLSQRSPQNCPMCGHPVDGHYCQGCALLRKKFKEDLFTSGIEHGILQDSSEPSNDNPNVVNALREPFVVNQDPGKNSSQIPPQINHHCCYGCGDPLEGIFYHQCTCKLCGNGAHYGYNCPPKVPIIPNPEPFNNQTIKELPPTV